MGHPAYGHDHGDYDEDEVLAHALRAKQRDAARVAWQRFSPVVRRIVLRALGPGSDAEDLVQEVFSELFARVHKLRRPKALKAFVLSITWFSVRQQLRQRNANSWLELRANAAALVTGVVHPDPIAREALARLRARLSCFSFRDRRAFLLRYVERLELVQVADALDMSLATTKRRLAHVRAGVKKFVEHDPLLSHYVQPSERFLLRVHRPDAPAGAATPRRGSLLESE